LTNEYVCRQVNAFGQADGLAISVEDDSCCFHNRKLGRIPAKTKQGNSGQAFAQSSLPFSVNSQGFSSVFSTPRRCLAPPHLGEMKTKHLVWGAAGLSLDFRGSDAAFEQSLKSLPESAPAE